MTNLNKSNQALQIQFDEILVTISQAKIRAYQNLNRELINLYWQIGGYISNKVSAKLWGKSVVENLAEYIKQKQPNLKGYSARNLWRMKQFYETYCENKFLSTLSGEISWIHNAKLPTLLAEISWSHNVAIFSRCKLAEEREFYIKLSIKERISFRELERQIDTSSFERVITAKDGISSALKTIIANKKDDGMIGAFKDTYILDFLDDLPEKHQEKDLQKALINGLKEFILEIGKDFCFVGQNFKLEVGNSDFYIDLLFYHRELRCLVCFELKTEKFKPEHLGQLNFYLEALDQDVKKPYENPSIGILLCEDKDSEVIKYAMGRSLSPTMVANYKTKLIPKKLLQDRISQIKESLEKL